MIEYRFRFPPGATITPEGRDEVAEEAVGYLLDCATRSAAKFWRDGGSGSPEWVVEVVDDHHDVQFSLTASQVFAKYTPRKTVI